MSRLFRGSLILGAIFFSATRTPAAEAEKPRLVVLVVFDQMRGDYPERWQSLFAEGGFARLQKDGAWFTDCHYPYAVTATGPGHASMLTGCAPDVHGIVQNQWYDRKRAEVVNCAESQRYDRVPRLPKDLPPEEPIEPVKGDSAAPAPKPKPGGTPEWLLAPTLGDALKAATGGKARVVGLSFKDRSALLPAGKSADAVYWLDDLDGMIVTSSYYRDSVHPWVAEFNKARVADRWFDKQWTRLLPDLDYPKYSAPDDAAGEGKGQKQGITFPHPMNGGLRKPGKTYYDALFNSPFGNEFLFELVKKAVVAERLGQDEITDLLVVSFSSNDAIGHTWGPDSQEVLDVTLRSDRLMADFLALLDAEVGKGKYVLAMTADHGVCPLPERTAKGGAFAKRLPLKKIYAAAEDHLQSTFGPAARPGPEGPSHWIENVSFPWVYLNQNLIAARELASPKVERVLADFLAGQEGIYRTFTRADMAGDFPANDPIGGRMHRSYHPARSGDVAIVLAPYCVSDGVLTGANHGSPHRYDTHVPLLVYGGGVRPGRRKDPVTPLAAAAILARAAGIRAPAKAVYPVPDALFGRD